MFVFRSTYNSLREAFLILKIRHEALVEQWNTLVKKVNSKGGQEFLIHAQIRGENRFTKEEIRQMIKLCHPDKHGGSKEAEAVTRKLLTLK